MSATEQNTPEEHKPLKIAGYGYLLGDAAMFAAAAARSGSGLNWGKIFGSSAWFVGGIGAARYGNPSKEVQLQLLASDLQDHLAKQGISIPKQAREQNALLRDKTLWEKTEEFFYRHPSEILNVSYGVGAVGILTKDGIPSLTKLNKTILPTRGLKNVSVDFWIGALVLSGAIGGLLIKENTNAAEEAKDGSMWDKATAFFKEKPLRWPALMYGLNNIPLAATAWQDFKQRGNYKASLIKQPYVYSTTQLSAYVLANTLLSLSKRNQMTEGEFPRESLSQLEQASASIIAAQPPEMQRQVLENVSAFLASQKGVKVTQAEIAEQLATRVAAASKAQLLAGMPESTPDAGSFVAKEAARRREHAELSAHANEALIR